MTAKKVGEWHILTEEEREIVRREYPAGASISALARRYGCSRPQITGILSEANIPQRRRRNYRQPVPSKKEIKEKSKEIQATWNETTERERAGKVGQQPYTVPSYPDTIFFDVPALNHYLATAIENQTVFSEDS